MNWLDILIVISVLAGFVAGLATGIVRGLLGLAGVIFGIILAGRMYRGLAPHLTFINSEAAANLAAFAIIFLAVMLVTALVSMLLRAVVAGIMLGWLDRLLGGALGLLIALISWALLLTLWAKYFGGSALQSSLIAPILVARFPLVLALLPPEFDSVRAFFG